MNTSRPVRYRLPDDPVIREVALPVSDYEPDAPPFIDATIRDLDTGTARKVRLHRSGDHDGLSFYEPKETP